MARRTRFCRPATLVTTSPVPASLLSESSLPSLSYGGHCALWHLWRICGQPPDAEVAGMCVSRNEAISDTTGGAPLPYSSRSLCAGGRLAMQFAIRHASGPRRRWARYLSSPRRLPHGPGGLAPPSRRYNVRGTPRIPPSNRGRASMMHRGGSMGGRKRV
ncbi:hypothetical protein BD310DRAFT_922014 [Dichomitus squalens]|uniref:Uncharacterized protein n=1 Tax=Dichomitus squalens TaxID=114155 RepID=A0A4Q9Q2G0_9APHY|nr:hypothetical protein BD310DRAFT_922014 [Dichomitus squalens]